MTQAVVGTQTCWNIWEDRGFLIHPDPVAKLSSSGIDLPLERDMLEHIESIAADLPELLASGRVRDVLDALPVYDMRGLNGESVPFHAVERLMQIYSYFASSFVYATNQPAANRIPAGVAVPLVQLSHLVERPPILSYSGYVLNNWARVDPDGGIVVDNLRLTQKFLGNKDEAWFILIHVDIEARAAAALLGIQAAAAAAVRGDVDGVVNALGQVYGSVQRMMSTFKRMPENCDSNVYYFNVRPYIFGFNEVVYEGVDEYGGTPQSFRGQTGAQSSIVPALVAAFGLEHERTGLMHHLEIMRDYMPKPHREFILHMRQAGIRDFVLSHAENRALTDVYNECLRAVLEFRKLHYHYATVYIFEKVANPIGTGGTVFMDWLGKLIEETEAQYIK